MIGAAIELLNTVGMEGATLKAIGEKAGYSRGLATHHFGTKAGLFRKLLRELSASWVRTLQDRVADRTGIEALSAANEAHLQHVLKQPDHLRAMYFVPNGNPANARGWAVGDGGSIRRSGDGGATFAAKSTLSPVNASAVFHGVHSNNSYVWAVGNGGVTYYRNGTNAGIRRDSGGRIPPAARVAAGRRTESARGLEDGGSHQRGDRNALGMRTSDRGAPA